MLLVAECQSLIAESRAMMAPMIVAVIGGETCTPDAESQAEAVGREVARRGCVLICGGRGGVMAAACRGARSQGGHTIGVLPGPDRSEANPWVEFVIVTGLGEARNAVIVRSADAVIAVGGAYGTLSEIAVALKLGRPVVGLGTWQIAIGGAEDTAIIRKDDPAEAVEAAVAAAGSLARP